jgi:uncharacterized protein DUF3592
MFVIAGIIAGALQANGLRVSLASRKWTAVPGRIRSAGLWDTGDLQDPSVARIEYTYEIRGHTRTGSRVRFGWLTTSEMTEREDVDRLNQFRDVTVYVDPEDRDQSVLEPGPTAGQWFVMAASLAALGAGAWLLVAR